MGLDVSHGCWHGAYSAFDRWRTLLTEAAGLPLMVDPYNPNRRILAIDWSRFTNENLLGDWDNPPDDPLLILLIHADDEGLIKSVHASHIAARLDQLAQKMPEDGVMGHLRRPRQQTLQFAQGLRRAASAEEDVQF